MMGSNGSGYQPRKAPAEVVARPPRNPSGELSRFIKLADILVDISEIVAINIETHSVINLSHVHIVIRGGVELCSPCMRLDQCKHIRDCIQGLLTSSMYRNTTTIHDLTPTDYVPVGPA